MASPTIGNHGVQTATASPDRHGRSSAVAWLRQRVQHWVSGHGRMPVVGIFGVGPGVQSVRGGSSHKLKGDFRCCY